MKNAFYFALKALFVFKTFKCLSWIFDHAIKKKRLVSKSMTSQPGKEIIAIYVLPKVSKNKGNHKMKFG